MPPQVDRVHKEAWWPGLLGRGLTPHAEADSDARAGKVPATGTAGEELLTQWLFHCLIRLIGTCLLMPFLCLLHCSIDLWSYRSIYPCTNPSSYLSFYLSIIYFLSILTIKLQIHAASLRHGNVSRRSGTMLHPASQPWLLHGSKPPDVAAKNCLLGGAHTSKAKGIEASQGRCLRQDRSQKARFRSVTLGASQTTPCDSGRPAARLHATQSTPGQSIGGFTMS